ncbi:hypothetical protein HAX54_036804 [Datura stramonium]|uniref:Isopenicillin N synthase-like Fe(2+) 2OG dioxygenase domain-containing protein n=1 Tax=Datura stramonium TaxID=4076 RepID=A0ABS8RQW2_DATST|nr:hypothetical protein [Datura stramonium]
MATLTSHSLSWKSPGSASRQMVNVNASPNSLLVNTGDHLEIFSNGKYKSNVHRAVVNNKVTRISVVTAHGPSLETIVRPASPLMEKENSTSSAYIPMKYRDYLELQQSNQLDAKTCLEGQNHNGIN